MSTNRVLVYIAAALLLSIIASFSVVSCQVQSGFDQPAPTTHTFDREVTKTLPAVTETVTTGPTVTSAPSTVTKTAPTRGATKSATKTVTRTVTKTVTVGGTTGTNSSSGQGGSPRMW